VDDIRSYSTNIDLINISSGHPPNIDKARYINNNTKLFTLNSITSNHNDYQLNFNIDYLNDYQKQNNSIINNFKYGDETITHTDNVSVISKNEKFKTNISYVSNISKRYIKNDFTIERVNKINYGKYTLDKDSSYQTFQNTFKNYTNKFSYIKNFGSLNISAGSYSSYCQTIQSLELTTFNDTNIFNLIKNNQNLRESIILSTFYLNNYISASKRLKNIIFESKFGNWNIYQKYNSEIYNRNIINNFNLFDSTSIISKNQLSSIYQNFVVSYIQKDLKISLNIPINYYFENINSLNVIDNSNQYISYNYAFTAIYNFSNKMKISTENTLNISPTSPYLISKGYILNNYRTFSNNEGLSANYKFTNTKIYINYKDVKNMFFLTIGFGNEMTNSNVSINRDFINSYIIDRQINKENLLTNKKYYFTINKYIPKVKSSLIAGISFENYAGLQIKRKIPYMFNNNIFIFNAKFNSKVSKYLIEYKINYLNQNIKNSNVNIVTYKNEVSIYTNFSESFFCKLNFENYTYPNFTSKTRNFPFADFSLFSQSKQKKQNIEIGMKNIFNINSFNNYSIYNNVFTLSEYKLRDRNIFISYNYTF
jgi:hypothetical protein